MAFVFLVLVSTMYLKDVLARTAENRKESTMTVVRKVLHKMLDVLGVVGTGYLVTSLHLQAYPGEGYGRIPMT